MLRNTLSLICLGALLACASTTTAEGTGEITNTPPVNNTPATGTGGIATNPNRPTSAGNANATTALTGMTITAADTPNLCLGIVGSSVDGAAIALQTCNGSALQRWFVTGNFIKTMDGKCVDTQDSTVTNYGENLVVRTCQSDAGNWFAMWKGMLYNTQNGNQWIAAGPENAAAQPNNNLIVAKYNPADSTQHWVVNVSVPGTGGTVTVSGFPIVSQTNPALCLTAVSSAVGVAACANTATQEWTLDGNGALLWMGGTNDCLDVNGDFNSITSGTLPVIKTCNGGAKQTWLYSNAWLVVGNEALNPNNVQPSSGFTPGVLLPVGYNWIMGGVP